MPSEWFLIVRDGTCPECGLMASSVAETDLGSAIVDEAQQWADLLERLGQNPSLTAHRRAGVWSALEYACHVRDTVELFAERARCALSSDDPHFQYQDQDAAVIDGRYNESDPRSVASELVANAQRFHLLLDALPQEGWRRSGTRRADERFDIALLARFALHEARHHRVDAERSAFQ